MKIDPHAYTASLHKCFVTPIASKSIEAIKNYIGEIEPIERYSEEAFIVNFEKYEEPNDFVIWKHPRSSLINCEKQLWVDVDFRKYRSVYKSVFPEIENYKELAIDHLMNRKLARAFDYKYIRLIHIDKITNTLHGVSHETLSIRGDKDDKLSKEMMQASHIQREKLRQINQQIQYADVFELSKLLNLKTYGRPYYGPDFPDISDYIMLFYNNIVNSNIKFSENKIFNIL